MVNQVILQGRFTADPELRKTGSDVSVCSFTIAWSEKYKETENQCFLRCTAWRQKADHIARYFRKGQEAVITGQLHQRKYQDKDGNNRTVIECQVQEIHFCGKKEEKKTADVEYAEPQKDAEVIEITGDEDLPF